MIEKEMKFLFADEEAEGLRRTIRSLSGVIGEGRAYEKSTMYDTAAGVIAARDARLRLREIRRADDSQTLEFCYKKRLSVVDGVKHEEEIECAFSADAAAFASLLGVMGYAPKSSYERYRETYRYQGVKITLDQFPFGAIAEIEGDEGAIAAARLALDLEARRPYPLSCDDAYRELCVTNEVAPKPHIAFDDPAMPRIHKAFVDAARA